MQAWKYIIVLFLCVKYQNNSCDVVGNSLPHSRSQAKFLNTDDRDDDDEMLSTRMPHSELLCAYFIFQVLLSG